MMIGMTGAIVGTANLVPRLCKSLYNDIVTAKKQPTAELLAAINEKQDIIGPLHLVFSFIEVSLCSASLIRSTK